MSGKNTPPKNLGPYAGLWENPSALHTGGRVVDPATGKVYTRDAAGHVTVSDSDAVIHRKAEDAKAKSKATASATSAAEKDLNAAQGYVWINGQRMRVTAVDAQGHPTAITFDNSALDKNGKPTGQLSNADSVFKALNLSDIPNASEPFLMSQGIKRDAQYNPILDSADMGNGLITQGKVGKNMLTIANGLQWFANLSVKDQGAYSHLVQQLKDSGYLPANASASMKTFSADAAHAFALAARDLAVVNKTPGGGDTTLDQFLTSAGGGSTEDKKAKAEAAYQPVNRDYQDPATLAATAKQAAQSALGRALNPDEEKRFLASFHGKQEAMYNAVDSSGRAQAGAQAVGESAAGATFYRPDTSGEADAYVNSAPFAQEKAGHDIGTYADVIKKMVGL